MKTNNRTEKLYTERASFYERIFVGFLGWGRELEAFFRRSNYIHPNNKILDVGCGTGIVTRVLHKLAPKGGAKFHAFDLTQNMLDILQQWIEEQGAIDIEWKQADVLEIETLPSHWKEYDLIVTATMLEYLPKAKVGIALANLRPLLKNDGILLAIITKRNLVTRWLAGKWWKTNLYEVNEIWKLLHTAGFHTIEFKKFSPLWSNFIMVIEAKK